MDTAELPAGSVVVGIDGSPWSHGALDWAIDQAALEQRPLIVVHAIASVGAQSMGLYASSGLDFARLVDDARADARKMLDAAVSHARDRAPDLDVHEVLSASDPRTVLLGLGERAAMIVVGSRGRGPVTSLLLGSVSVSVSKHATCPVVVLRPNPAQFGRGILVGVDGTEASVPATEFAYRMASFRALPLTVLHSDLAAQAPGVSSGGRSEPDNSEALALVSEALAGMEEKFPDVQVTTRLTHGFADHQLIKLSSGYDLVVVGHHQPGALADFIYGSVAPTVLEHADGAVAVVPSCPPTS